LDDIAIANELAAELFGSALDELSFPSRELLRHIGEFVAGKMKAEGQKQAQPEWTRRELREAIHWTEARVRLHLAELVRLEYIVPLSGRFGSRFRYQLLIEPGQIAENRRLNVAFKPIEQLAHEANLAGLGTNLAATSQAPGCEVESPAKAHEHKA